MTVATHLVRFYDADTNLLQALRSYVGDALRGGESAVVVANEQHSDELNRALLADGHDVAAFRAAGRYVELDAATTLAQFMVDRRPDPARFEATIEPVIVRAEGHGTPVRAFGEMVALLADGGNYAAATELEALWSGLQRKHHFTLLCAYRTDVVAAAASPGFLATVCDLHTEVAPIEGPTTDANEHLRTIVQLQQKARALEFEIAARQRAEERLRFALANEHAALEAAEAARASAEAASQLRDEFLSIAAHELRTPLTSLLGNVQLLNRKFDRPEPVPAEVATRMLSQVGNDVKKLSRLLGQLMDVSRLQAGKLSLDRQQLDLSAVARGFVDGLQVWDQSHPITIEAPQSLLIDGDPIRLEQVLTNLVDNAVKYSPDGGPVHVILRALTEHASPAIELAVRDTGIGIPPASRPYMFDRFFQAHTDNHRRGLGLGLYICRQIVELHGGTIAAEFPADGGTRIIVRLPAPMPTEASTMASTA